MTKTFRYFLAGLAFLIVWMALSMVVHLAIDLALGPESDNGFPWRFAPGGIIGMGAGIYVFRVFSKAPQNKEAK